MIRWCTASLMSVALVACGAPDTAAPNSGPSRVVSLDYCADQYVLKLISRDRIAAVSGDADKAFSYMRDAATGLQTVYPRAENILALRPDIVVRSYGGGAGMTELLEAAGIEVVQIGWASDLDGVQDVVTQVARDLGEADAGARLVSDMQRRLEAIASDIGAENERPSALYMTPGGVTTGPGSIIDTLFQAAGLSNFENRPGWHDIPLEQLVSADPDLIVFASFDDHVTPWSVSRHPVAREKLKDVKTVRIDGAMTSCTAWYLVDAVEAIAEAS